MKLDEKFLYQLKNHKAQMMGFEEARVSAVCIPFVRKVGAGSSGRRSGAENDEVHILFEVRSSDLPEQPGDICLPGGMLEEGETPAEAAVRELCEELLLPEEAVTRLGDGDILYNGSIIIHTFIVEIPDLPYTGNEEVAEVFTVPLSFFLETEPEVYYVERSARPEESFPFDRIQGGRNYQWRTAKTATYFYQWKDKTIWGLTARIIRGFAGICNEAGISEGFGEARESKHENCYRSGFEQ